MHEYYEKTFTIRSSDVDIYSLCRPSALMGFFQDMATDHSQLLHMDQDYLRQNYNACWLLVRMWYRLYRPLRMGDQVTFRTWHRGAGGLIIYRDFDLFVDGTPVGEAVSAWVVADMGTRKMLRPGGIENLAASPVPETVKEKQLKLIRSPKEKRFIHRREVRYSDLDLNGHMNNTKYADVAMDVLTAEEMRGRFISELQLNYSMECGPGEVMDISRAMEDTSCYIDGCSEDGARRFEALVHFTPYSVLTEDGGLE